MNKNIKTFMADAEKSISHLDPNMGAAGHFEVAVKRLTHTIAQKLPVPLFGAIAIKSGYNKVLSLPSGITLEISNGITQEVPTPGDYPKVVLTYNDGANTDVVEITTNSAAPYPSLLAALQTERFVATNVKAVLSDQAQTQQFDNPLEIIDLNLFDKLTKNSLNFNHFKSKDQQQDGIIDVTTRFGINKDRSMVVNMDNTTGNGFVLNLIFAVQQTFSSH